MLQVTESGKEGGVRSKPEKRIPRVLAGGRSTLDVEDRHGRRRLRQPSGDAR